MDVCGRTLEWPVHSDIPHTTPKRCRMGVSLRERSMTVAADLGRVISGLDRPGSRVDAERLGGAHRRETVRPALFLQIPIAI